MTYAVRYYSSEKLRFVFTAIGSDYRTARTIANRLEGDVISLFDPDICLIHAVL